MSSDYMVSDINFRSRVLYRVLRVLAGIITLIAGMLISSACVLALMGSPEFLIDIIDDEATSLALNIPTILAIVVTNVMAIVTLGMLFFALNRLLNHAERGDLLVDPASNAMKQLGIAMIMLYLTTQILVIVVPIFGFPGFWEENALYIPFIIFDLDFLYVLIGSVLLIAGRALREGQVAKEEAKQYV